MEKTINFLPPVVLRIGISLLYLWFGFSQIFNPGEWISFLPDYASLVPVSREHIVLINGLSEVFMASLILIGWKVRWVASFLAIHAFHILITVGYNAIGVRDFGILVAVVTIALNGADRWSLDSRPSSNQITL
jgi:uncharacterized membrane protein YphA (DoxX/SURF4 family)